MITIPISWIILSFFVAFFGRYRRMGFWGYFFASLFLTPVIGMLLVIISGPGSGKTREDKKADDKEGAQ